MIESLESLRDILNADAEAATSMAVQALESVAWPRRSAPILMRNELSEEQLTLAQALAPLTPLHIAEYAIPLSARVRQRWLGLTPGGPLEEVHDFKIEGKKRPWPLWRYLSDENVDEDDRLGFLGQLPQTARMQVLAELVLESYKIDLDYQELHWDSIDAEQGESADWASRFADELMELFEAPPSIEANQLRLIVGELKDLVFFPLCRAGLPIEERWDVLVPITKNKPRMEEIVAALPEERKDAILTARLGEAMALTAVTVSLDILAYHPSPAIAAQVERWLKDEDWERNLGRDFARAARRRFKQMNKKDRPR